ncbi:ester hydrolase C11 [Capsaspora owczarzaki ATCC 30864]|uniref:ester hydrolase C11 n=1 Tax=Capsaspora owczarzaki (strain ATCC 30864) TaxID=595528 RepID=UPI0001FE3FF4|nr:ester hydrolase C11 [Capsaspora owczarzaki ATCC 30864]|eukprot:XP_004364337.1 ester hydrolase C11 [Capsaspora owczarzaki ATCC 30864]
MASATSNESVHAIKDVPAEVLAAVEKKALHVPSLDELSAVLQHALQANFANASATPVEVCPDLTAAPYHLAAPGINGSPRLADVGGVPYLIPTANRNVLFDLQEVATKVDLPGAFFIGAGAGSWKYIGTNCELMPNVHLGASNNLTTTAIVAHDKCELRPYDTTQVGVLCNVLASEGVRGPVVHVKASVRTGPKDFLSCLHQAIVSRYGQQGVGLGGVFVIREGKAKIHVMPDFSPVPLCSDAEVDQWLKFYEMQSPLVCLSTMVSGDLGLDLRLTHTHCFSNHGEGGHYHYDTTPEVVEYEGYLVPAEHIYRIGRPQVTHKVGRD